MARLLPMSIAESESSKWSTILTATPARFEPPSRAFSSLMRLQEEYDISAEEKMCEKMMQMMIPQT